jgi:hypothetical protein
MLNSFGPSSSRIFGPSLTASLQLKPQLAVQVGTTVTWRNYSSSYSAIDKQLRRTVYTYKFLSNLITIPALLRYTLTPVAKRLQLYALVELSLLVNTGRNTNITTYPDQTQYENSNRYSDLHGSLVGSLVVGPALRYSLTPCVALTAEFPINLIVGDSYGSFSDRLFYNLQVGVRYNFG